MSKSILTAIFFNPPFAIARIGSGDAPVEAFEWANDPTIHGALQTVIRPALTLEVTPEYVVRPYLPTLVHFKDGHGIRPTAPFFELWGVFDEEDGTSTEAPLTLERLAQIGATPAHIAYEVTAANLKAARRTQDTHCGFAAYAAFSGDDYGEHELLATSHAAPDAQPLVFADAPIPLGSVQVIRPVHALEMGVDLSTVRLRFMPAKGLVYGPPAAISGPAPRTLRVHEIVAPERRILNPNATWTAKYDASYASFDNPEPSDTYDGADTDLDPASRAWGVVDDACDATIDAYIVPAGGRRLRAHARLTSGPPDFAPDRRPFVSLADDLTQRVRPDPEPPNDETFAEVADIFTRVFEVISLLNVDYVRDRAIIENRSGFPEVTDDGAPHVDERTMTASDAPYADQAPKGVGTLGPDELPYSGVARDVHVDLASEELISGWLRDKPNRDRVRLMMRPPFAAFDELPEKPHPVKRADETLRDPRVFGDWVHDMRMPPYMRDELSAALSLTHRQYRKIVEYLDYLDGLDGVRRLSASAGGAPTSAIERHLRRFVQRREDAAAAARAQRDTVS